jgi:pantetheine-phosphate adenylyltransferase
VSRVAVYPGSFDPITRGHEDLIRRSLRFADRVIVAVADNSSKSPLFTLDERVQLAKKVLAGESAVEVKAFKGLLVDFARDAGATMVVRGLRAVADFDYEFQMALMNRQLYDELESVFLVPALHLTYLSASIVREVARLGGDVSAFVHPEVGRALKAKFAR